MEGNLRNMTSLYILNGDSILLLLRQGGRVANNLWIGSAGGHFEENELNNAMACILREMKEEIHITGDMLHDMRLRYITLRRTSDEIRQNYYFFAELNDGLDTNFASNEGELRWFKLSEISRLPMPFTSQYVMEHYLQTGIDTEEVYGGIADGNRVVFIPLPAF